MNKEEIKIVKIGYPTLSPDEVVVELIYKGKKYKGCLLEIEKD